VLKRAPFDLERAAKNVFCMNKMNSFDAAASRLSEVSPRFFWRAAMRVMA
jgi:hypothetical protein